jgi:hypothetical protein
VHAAHTILLLLLLQGALILKILRGKYPTVQGYSKELTDIVKACLTLVSELSYLSLCPAAVTYAAASLSFA